MQPYIKYVLIGITLLTFTYYTHPIDHYTETFTNKKWPKELVKKFIIFQQQMNPNLDFDMDIVQQQATEKEAEELLKTGYWPWNQDVINLYNMDVQHNFIIKTAPGDDLRKAQSIYNQNAIMQLLSYKTKEGSFLLNGVTIGHSKNMPKNVNNIVKCSSQHSDNGEIKMEKLVYTGYNSINGNMIKQVSDLSNTELPYVINGFRFKDKPCNPCLALKTPADYSCQFELNTGDGYKTSPIWKMLWNQ